MNQWISINEAVPDFDCNVLVSVSGKSPYVTIASLSSIRESSCGKSYEWDEVSDRSSLYCVDWWMPLPEPATIPEPQ